MGSEQGMRGTGKCKVEQLNPSCSYYTRWENSKRLGRHWARRGPLI